jgi:hypothetical protein
MLVLHGLTAINAFGSVLPGLVILPAHDPTAAARLLSS